MSLKYSTHSTFQLFPAEVNISVVYSSTEALGANKMQAMSTRDSTRTTIQPIYQPDPMVRKPYDSASYPS